MELPGNSPGTAAPTLGADRISQVFVADDSEFVRGVIRKALETQLNLKVCGEAADGPEAIEKARSLLPDVVILDLAMPTMNGLEVATTLRKHLPEAIIVLVTVYENALGRAVGSTAAMKTGINAALSKHEGINKIVATIQELITQSQTPAVPEPSASPAASFDLFRIEPDGQIQWLEAVPDLHTAKARLQILGVSAPGRYLVFSQATENKLPFEVSSQGVLTSIPQIRA